MFLLQFKDVMILILLIAAIISGFIGDITDTIVIVVIVLLNAILGFYQEYRADKAMQALKKMSVTQARVLRNNQMVILPATQLVPGDVVLLETGNAVPADIRLMESIHLKTEEAALTGESQAINKMTQAIINNTYRNGLLTASSSPIPGVKCICVIGSSRIPV